MIYKDYAEASNKLLLLQDANKPTLFIIQLELNNLYQHLMMQLLPTEILNWVNHFILDDCSNNGLIDCFLEIDFDYSDQHDMQNDYLFLETIKPLKGEDNLISEKQLLKKMYNKSSNEFILEQAYQIK